MMKALKPEAIWIGGLFVAALIWATVLNRVALGTPVSFDNWLVYALPKAAIVFVVPGIVAAAVDRMTKSRDKAMWTWTILLLVGFVILSL